MDITTLIRNLNSPDEKARSVAQDELATEMNDGMAEAIAAIALNGDSETLRENAIVALGPVIEECGDEYHFGSEEDQDAELGPSVSRATFESVVQRIRGIYSDPAQPVLLRRRAFEVLVRDPEAWHAAEIRTLLASDDPDWRLTAIFAMGMVPGFDKELVALLETSTGVHLAEAVRAAGQMEVIDAAKRVRALAASDETDHDVRLEAILALPGVDDDAYDLLDELSASEDEEIAEAADEALDELNAFGDSDEE